MRKKGGLLFAVGFCLIGAIVFGIAYRAKTSQTLGLAITPIPSSIEGETVASATMSGSGLLALGTTTGRVSIFDRNLRASHGGWKQSAGSSEILGIAFSQDEAAIAAITNNEVTVWHFDDPTAVKIPLNGSFTAMALSSEGRLLALAKFDVSVFDVSTQRLVGTFEQQVADGGTGTYENLAFDSHSMIVAAASLDSFDTWLIKNGKKTMHWSCECDADGASFSKDARLAVVGTKDARALLRELRMGEPVKEKTMSTLGGDHVYGIAVNLSGTLVAAGTAAGSVVVWDTRSGTIVGRATPTNQPIIGVTSSDDGQTLLVEAQKVEYKQGDYDRWLMTLSLR